MEDLHVFFGNSEINNKTQIDFETFKRIMLAEDIQDPAADG
jgi:hypothetical protein